MIWPPATQEGKIQEGNPATSGRLSIIGKISRANPKLENTLNRVISQKLSLFLHYRDLSRRPCQIFLESPLYTNHPKKHKWVTEPTWAIASWPEVQPRSYKAMFCACISPDLHLVEWTNHNVGLSYFVSAHTVHLSGWRLLLNSQLSPPQTSVLLQQWSEVANTSELLLSLSYWALSMISYSATLHPRW